VDVVHLDVELVLDITTMALAQDGQGSARVRDFGLLESAVHRPRGSSFGDEHYPGLFEKAAALMPSPAGNHVFIDGNKRAAWNCAATFLEVNAMPLRDPVDADRAERFVLDVCTGRLEDVARIAAEPRTFHEVP